MSGAPIEGSPSEIIDHLRIENEALRSQLAAAERERDSLARRCAVRFEETEATLDVVRLLRAGRKPDLDDGLWWRSDLRVSWPMTPAHRAVLDSADATPTEAPK